MCTAREVNRRDLQFCQPHCLTGDRWFLLSEQRPEEDGKLGVSKNHLIHNTEVLMMISALAWAPLAADAEIKIQEHLVYSGNEQTPVVRRGVGQKSLINLVTTDGDWRSV